VADRFGAAKKTCTDRRFKLSADLGKFVAMTNDGNETDGLDCLTTGWDAGQKDEQDA
jgi:hypothetical protein